MPEEKDNRMEKIVSLCKRRGFVYQGSEIYGGLAGTWDYGPLGVALKNNIKNLWWRMFVDGRDDMYGLDAAILMNAKVWEASGHVATFSDPVVECKKCGKQFRVESKMSSEQLPKEILEHQEAEHLGVVTTYESIKQDFTEKRDFNLMFQTKVGAGDNAFISYLRPETAGGIFVNFKNVVDSFHPKLPFGIGQIGKAFRNEIAPRDFIFRLRELEQMEIEYFVRPEEWEKYFEAFRVQMHEWTNEIGLQESHVHEIEIADEDRAHYSKRTIDFEFDFPFGQKELYGLAYRTDYDLTAHKLAYQDEETNTRIVPHVIEPSFGVDRTFLAILSDAYTEDTLGGEVRTFLKLSQNVAPVRAAIFPLLKNKPELMKKAREVFALLKKEMSAVEFDDNGNIGKRYRRQDEIGTPHCVTIDFETLDGDQKDTVTVRDRDTGEQRRVAIADLTKYLQKD